MKRKKTDWKYLAKDIVNLVGSQKNFATHYNCVTRMRFKILDKNLVDEKKIKELKQVKGVVWNGQEIQIVIGPDVTKLKEAIDYILSGNDKNKVTIGKKITQFITGVLTPAWPVIMATGIIAGLQSLFAQFGWVETPSAELLPTQLDFFSFFMYVGARVGLEMLGVIFCYNTVKYLGGSPVMGIYLGLALASRYFIGPGFGAEAGTMEHNGTGFILFKLFGNNVYLKGYESSILPMIFGGIFIFWFDKLMQKIIPGAVDIVFRPAIVFFISFAAVLFIIGPIAGLIEQLLGQLVTYVGKIPGGIGIGIVAMIWQPLVVTGTHIAVANVVKLPILNGGSSALSAMFGVAILAQFGALIGVAIKTKDSKSRQAAFASMPACALGITEPAIYGTTLPKITPFLAGCIAAFFGGVFAGVLKLDGDVIGAGGFLQILWFTDSLTEMGLYLVVLIFTIILSTIITFFLYNEQKKPSKEFKKSLKILGLESKEFNIINLDKINKQLNKSVIESGKNKNEDVLIKNEKLKQKLINEIENENAIIIEKVIKDGSLDSIEKTNLVSNALNVNLINLNLAAKQEPVYIKPNAFISKIKSRIQKTKKKG